MPEASLLPSNATPFERAQSLADAVRWPLPVDLVKSVWNPATCPLDLLPYLAAGLGLEIWHDDWSEAFKRATIADIWALKRNKTKLKGLAAYAGLEGGRIVKAVRPPLRPIFTTRNLCVSLMISACAGLSIIWL